ncbi:MAG: nuclear transport factor 2 family protein, partial [Pseudomonadota bacterium]
MRRKGHETALTARDDAAERAAGTVSISGDGDEATAGGTESLQQAFRGLAGALAAGDLDSFYGYLHEDCRIIDEDIPFILTKDDFKDHIDFHVRGTWDSFSWQARAPQFAVFGATGVVGGYATFRGKPTDAGFRQRHMAITQGWARTRDGWRLINW